MQSTRPVPSVPVSPRSLAGAFSAVPEPRRAASVVSPLPAVLALAVAAILADHLSVLAIAEWGARQGQAVLGALGLPPGRAPRQSTVRRLFAKLDGDALAAALTAYFAPQAGPAGEALQGVAIDGKAQRGRLRFPGGGCPVHAPSAFCHERGFVLAHEPIDPAAGLDTAEAELSVAPAFLDRIDWHDRVLTGDALHCQRPLCRRVLDGGGDYPLTVKQNQALLHHDIRLLFDPPPDAPALPLRDRRVARTLDAGHGRTWERRELVASTDLVGYLDWPGQAQVFRLQRTWRAHDRTHGTVHDGVTSLPPARADATRLLELRRGHWAIENLLHRTKDVNFAEDASLIHAGSGPTVMALLRDAAVSLLRGRGIRQVAARLRRHGQRPAEAVALVVGPPPTRA